MTEAIIQKELYRRFYSHKYELCNSFIFGGWESDFFSVADSAIMHKLGKHKAGALLDGKEYKEFPQT